MKSIRLILIALLVITAHSLYAQASNKTDTIKVWGECGMCKNRIEKALKLDGIIKASWNEDTKMLTVEYNAAKIANTDIQKKVAAVGHDTELFRADDKVYSKLPGCCKYDRKPNTDKP